MKFFNINELTKSKYMYNTKPPRILNYFLFVILISVIIFIYLSMIYTKTEVIRLQGILQNKNQVSVSSNYSGQIKDIKFKEGDHVNEGDMLIEISSEDLNHKKQQVEENVKSISNRINLIDRLQKNLENKVNTFDVNDDIEKEFYYKVQKYFTECSEYDIDVNGFKEMGYDEKQAIEQNRIYGIRKKYFYIDNFNTASNEKASLKNQLDQLESQLNTVTDEVINSNIVATDSGIIHYPTQLKKGQHIELGTNIASISKEDKREYLMIIPAKERTRIEIGSKVSIVVDGLLQQEYGTLKGEVTEIDVDSSVNYNNEIYFRGLVKIDQDYLLDSKTSEKIIIPSGVTSTIRVEYNEVSYFKYFLDILGIEI